MRKFAKFILGVGTVAVMLGTIAAAPDTHAAGKLPDKKVCKSKPQDAVTQGGCIVANRKKGNCWGCHMIKGTIHGNIAPPLVSIAKRFPDKSKLRTQVWDASKLNKNSVMPPYGKHGILSEDEIDKVVEFLLTL